MSSLLEVGSVPALIALGGPGREERDVKPVLRFVSIS